MNDRRLKAAVSLHSSKPAVHSGLLWRLNFLRAAEDATPIALRVGDVVFNCVGGHVSDAAVEFAATPQVASPENPAKMRERLKQSTRANTLKQLDNAGNTHVRVEAHKLTDTSTAWTRSLSDRESRYLR